MTQNRGYFLLILNNVNDFVSGILNCEFQNDIQSARTMDHIGTKNP